MERDGTLDGVRALLEEALGMLPGKDGDARMDRVRTAIRSAIDATASGVEAVASAIAPPTTSLDRIVAALEDGLSRSRRELERKVADAERSLGREGRWSGEPGHEPDPEYLEDLATTRDSGRKVLEMIDRMRETVKTSPETLLVPIGTTVETLDHHAGPYVRLPVSGSRGVVVGYAPGNENVNVVSFPSEVKDADGCAYGFDEDEQCPERPPSFRYPAEALKVVSPARAWGGGRIDHAGYVATHLHDGEWPRGEGHDMVVEAMGWLWRVQEINGIPERTQMTRVSTPECFDFLRPAA